MRLIRNPLGMTEREMLLEKPDADHRTLHSYVIERDGVRDDEGVATAWRWRPVPGEAGPIVMLQCHICLGDHCGI